MRIPTTLLCLAASLLVPELAHAHAEPSSVVGLVEGLRHPIAGWDHLLAMLAVGIWAAQQRGRAIAAVPVAFVAAMAAGALFGASGLALPVVEPMIAASVLLFGVWIGVRARLTAATTALLAVFAFAHGFAHAAEIPVSASFASFGTGFVATTIALHGAGWLLARVAAAGITSLVAASDTWAQSALDAAHEPSRRESTQPRIARGEIEEVVVRGRADSLVGITESASQGTVGFEQLRRRPLLRTGEILEAVPGVIITQHSGGGKANQYFLRGFNLDHGTDFATDVDGVPVNLPSHGHGQGYTDLGFVIPELVERIDYRKGPYYADTGDFSSAGRASLALFDRLDHALAKVEGGRFGHVRGVAATSADVGPGHLLVGFDASRADGPWKRGDDFRRVAGALRYGVANGANRVRLTALAYRGKWDATDQIAESAVDRIGRFGSLDDTTGGDSQRYSVQLDWDRDGASSDTHVGVYGVAYDMDLFSNFTYFAADPVRGDQFEQEDRRLTAGLRARHSWPSTIAGFEARHTVGLQLRSDRIDNGLYNTERRRRVEKIDRDGAALPAVIRRDEIHQTSLAPYFETDVRWHEKLRTTAGVRLDAYRFRVDDENGGTNSGTRRDAIASPKLSVVLGPWADTEIYAQAGLGFHSNDARGANTRIDPVTGDPTRRADPLVRTKGAEIGMRTTRVPGLHSTVSLWWLDIDSELVFVGDAGTTEAGRPSRRYGIELANYYTPTEWLTVDADASFSHARFRDRAPEGRRVPGAIESVVAAGVAVGDDRGWSASLRLRFFGSRPLTEDDRFRASRTLLLSGGVRYAFDETWSFAIEGFNLLDRADSDIEYAYESAIDPASPIREEVHLHPVEPISARVSISARF